jgi:hypothetical protein
MPIPYTHISGDGAFTHNVYPDGPNEYHGISIDAGAAWPQGELGVGIASGVDRTTCYPIFNIYELIDDMCIKILEE